MTKIEVEEHRDRYSSLFKAKPERSPWTKSFEGMGLKTILKALFRNLAISPEIDKAVHIDDTQEIEKDPGFRNVTENAKGATSDQVAEKLAEQSEKKPEKTPPKQEEELF